MANFRKKFQQLEEICAVVIARAIAPTATCTKENQHATMTDLCVNDAVIIQHSADRPNIFFQV